MIDRGTVLRGFFALMLVAVVCSVAYVFLSDTDGTSGNFVEDGDGRYKYGPIFEEPEAWGKATVADPFVRNMKVAGGGTFGSTITKQVRIDIDGTGPIPSREVTLQTRPAVQLFAGERADRATEVLHGIQRILEERGGLLEGISIARTRGGVEAAAISGIVEAYPTDSYTTPAEKQMVLDVLEDVADDLAGGAFAWYDPRFQQVVMGPEIARGLHTWIEAPKRAKPAANLFTAYVVRHELEHAITPAGEDVLQYRWLEEGTADTIARWPGAAAETARELGMPYPKRFDRVQYSTNRGGYPEYVDALRILLGAAGVDWKDPKQLDAAYDLLQERELRDVPKALAERIATRNRLGAKERNRIERLIRGVDGSPAKARRAVAGL